VLPVTASPSLAMNWEQYRRQPASNPPAPALGLRGRLPLLLSTAPQAPSSVPRNGWSVRRSDPATGESELRFSLKRAREEEDTPQRLTSSTQGPQHTTVALLVREPWVTLLCQGKKTWELRGSRTHKRGRVALACAGGGGVIVGSATLVACHGPLTADQLVDAQALHCVPGGGTASVRYKEVYAWEFTDAARLAQPLPYAHPPGAIIWVNLPAPILV
jgi:hypothetical protein